MVGLKGLTQKRIRRPGLDRQRLIFSLMPQSGLLVEDNVQFQDSLEKRLPIHRRDIGEFVAISLNAASPGLL